MQKRFLPALLLTLLVPVAAVAARVPASFAAAYQRGSAWSVGVRMCVPGEDEPRVGAGFFVDDKGSVATAAHLLDPSQQIRTLAGTRIVVQRSGEEPVLVQD